MYIGFISFLGSLLYNGSSFHSNIYHCKNLLFFSSVQLLSHVRLFVTPMNCSPPGFPAHHPLPAFTQTHIHRVGDAIQPSHPLVPFFSCPQSLPASESFPMNQLFAWGGQSTGVSALTSFFPKKSQGWSPLEWTGWISLEPKELPRVFSNITVQKHHFFSTQLSSESNSHMYGSAKTTALTR